MAVILPLAVVLPLAATAPVPRSSPASTQLSLAWLPLLALALLPLALLALALRTLLTLLTWLSVLALPLPGTLLRPLALLRRLSLLCALALLRLLTWSSVAAALIAVAVAISATAAISPISVAVTISIAPMLAAGASMITVAVATVAVTIAAVTVATVTVTTVAITTLTISIAMIAARGSLPLAAVGALRRLRRRGFGAATAAEQECPQPHEEADLRDRCHRCHRRGSRRRLFGGRRGSRRRCRRAREHVRDRGFLGLRLFLDVLVRDRNVGLRGDEFVARAGILGQPDLVVADAPQRVVRRLEVRVTEQHDLNAVRFLQGLYPVALLVEHVVRDVHRQLRYDLRGAIFARLFADEP